MTESAAPDPKRIRREIEIAYQRTMRLPAAAIEAARQASAAAFARQKSPYPRPEIRWDQ